MRVSWNVTDVRNRVLVWQLISDDGAQSINIIVAYSSACIDDTLPVQECFINLYVLHGLLVIYDLVTASHLIDHEVDMHAIVNLVRHHILNKRGVVSQKSDCASRRVGHYSCAHILDSKIICERVIIASIWQACYSLTYML